MNCQTLSPDDAPIMVHVSNFRPVKRPVDCVEILARVLKKTNARLVMVGDGSERTNAIHRPALWTFADYCVLSASNQILSTIFARPMFCCCRLNRNRLAPARWRRLGGQVPVMLARGRRAGSCRRRRNGISKPRRDLDKMAEDAARLLMDPQLRREMKRARFRGIAL